MWWFLVLLGVLIALAGLAVIALGVSIFVSTFGNTLITTGAVAASGGFVITAMGLVLRQLERLSQQVERAYPGTDVPEGGHPARVGGRGPQGRLTVDDLVPPEPEALTAEPAPAALPPVETRERIAPPPRTASLQAPAEPGGEAADPMVEARRQRLQRRAEPQPQSQPSPAPAPAPPPRPRTGYEPPPRPARPAAEQQPAPAVPPAPPPRREPEEPRILKSGIVGGMAYTLYSDGSIQADLPDGVVRFASLQELRDHVAQSQGER
ncbi:hypothetical protein K9U40_18755 [Xanthobacter autotrophicus]|uniref:hypothetical protein n=1 Tax=Xanthobacter TaxID=279 RepID=UPI0024AB8DF6|nr:hypothetical protein [Xanthobacter autotrophicus]MDI4666347.1 hypothetical protein [Xanthobacter autotrophicus]